MISKMEIWLKCGKDSIQLPILPASYNVTRDAGHETVNVQNLGDVTILGKKRTQFHRTGVLFSK